ncbi:MAG: sodium:alanine symporter family protein [Clostridiales Family XIII bacterium]|jgi:AGCS family alanine or glycine:cation symporter|nr:sodium:alanine symporter family protein [Clostridiales Family XIII bacterium]
MAKYEAIINWFNGYLWGPPLLILLFGTHLFMTVRTGFIQKKIGTAIKLSVTKDAESEGDISQFAALTTALASTIGTGNIVGVGTAIALGGPGAVLWMWLTGVFGIATKYSESFIAVKYRVKTEKGEMLGGAMYALQRGLNLKWLGILFAAFALLASFGIGSGVQANATAKLLKNTMHIPTWVTGVALVILLALVLLGGLHRIASVCEKLVPFMSVVYVVGCVILLVMNRHFLIPAVETIVTSAFTAKAAGGGFIASGVMAAMRFGVARGLFSNESGMGSAPFLAAAARTKNPVRQALVSSTGTFWDTVVICLMTGLVLVSSILAHTDIGSAASGDGSLLTTLAFSKLGVVGPIVLAFGMITFASSTMLGWSYYGDRCAEYLFGNKAVIPYRIIYTLFALVGATASLNAVWSTADALNALMAIPNIIAVLALSGVIAKETKYYLKDLDKIDPTPVPFRSEVDKKFTKRKDA